MNNPYEFPQDRLAVRPLPNATLTLVLGILSLMGICCYGVIGLAMSIITLVLAHNESKTYKRNPELYTPSSLTQVTIGRVLALIGLAFSLLFLGFIIFLILAVGVSGLQDPEAIRQALEGYM